MNRTAIYPGSFDPVTYGHIDLIKRAATLFDRIIVGVASNTRKQTLFNADERLVMLKETTKGIKGISIELFDGLVIKYAYKHKSHVLIRGLRVISDFDYEVQMALTNRRLDQKIETILLVPSEGYTFLSSSLIKEAASLGADISSFVPKIVEKKLKKKLSQA